MASPSCNRPGRHLSLERVVDAEKHPRTSEMDVEELAVISELVIVIFRTCRRTRKSEVHIFDLMTNLWREDIALDLGGRQLGLSSYLRRFHTLTPSLLGIVLHSDDISVQQLGKDRCFTLLYTFNFGIIAKQIRFVDGFFISPDTPNCPLNLRRQCILEAAVGDIDRKDPLVRRLSSIQYNHSWDHSDSNNAQRVFRHENNVYVVRKSEMFVFECSTRQLSGVRDLGLRHFFSDFFHISFQMIYYELPSIWSSKRTRLIPSGNIRQEFEQATDIEWWSMKKDNRIQPSCHFCVSPSSFTDTDNGIPLPSVDIMFVGNSNSIYRIPARCFGKVKKLTELAKDALLTIIPVTVREVIKASVVDFESLGTQVCTKFYS